MSFRRWLGSLRGFLQTSGLQQYEISNFSRPGFQSRHNLRYWERRPYLGLGLDASSMLRAAWREGDSAESRYVMRSTTTDDLAAFLQGPERVETAWLGPARQLEEAWSCVPKLGLACL